MSRTTERGSRGTLAARVALALTVMVLVTAACASDPTQSEEYTSLQAQYEEASAQLAETQSRLVGAEAALADSRQENADTEKELAEAASTLTATEDRVAALEGSVESMLARLDTIRAATAAHVSGDLIISMGGFDEVAGSGIATSVGDSLVASFDLPGGSWEAFATDPGWFWCWCEQVQELGDPATTAALEWWFDTPVGSEEEFWAWYEVQLRVLGLMADEIDAAIEVGAETLDADPVVTAR